MGLALDDGSLLDGLLTLSQDELDVARVGHVGVDLVEISGWCLRFCQRYIHDREHGRSFSGPWEPG